MAKKYTDEQLSRILGEHDCGHLRIYGAENWARGGEYPKGCINQAAYNSHDINADYLNVWPARKFDFYYEPFSSPEELLELIEGANEEQ